MADQEKTWKIHPLRRQALWILGGSHYLLKNLSKASRLMRLKISHKNAYYFQKKINCYKIESNLWKLVLPIWKCPITLMRKNSQLIRKRKKLLRRKKTKTLEGNTNLTPLFNKYYQQLLKNLTKRLLHRQSTSVDLNTQIKLQKD